MPAGRQTDGVGRCRLVSTIFRKRCTSASAFTPNHESDGVLERYCAWLERRRGGGSGIGLSLVFQNVANQKAVKAGGICAQAVRDCVCSCEDVMATVAIIR